MNLIDSPLENCCNFIKFRKKQYDLIPDYLHNITEYLENIGYDIPKSELHIIPSLTYRYYMYNALRVYKLQIYENQKNIKDFLKIAIPDLVDDIFFILADIKYVPAVYAWDEPINIKKSSILLYSLFCPITLYFKNKRAIILGTNVALDSLLQFYLGYHDALEVANILDLKKFRHQDDEAVFNYFKSIFKRETKEEIIELIDKLFFDNWTRELYRRFYNLKEITFKTILELAVKNYGEKIHFTDLRHKRLVFIEALLKPLARSTGFLTKRIIEGENIHSIYLNVPQDGIIKNFIKNLNSNFFYDTVNGYTSILAHKISFKNPYGSGIMPTEISSIHESHKEKICPVTISNTKPGETVSLTPDVEIDSQFGIFLNT